MLVCHTVLEKRGRGGCLQVGSLARYAHPMIVSICRPVMATPNPLHVAGQRRWYAFGMVLNNSLVSARAMQCMTIVTEETCR